MTEIVIFLGWLTFVVLGGEALNWLLVRALPYKWYRWSLSPGIIVHELSHAVACFIVGARVEELALLSPTGGHVKHTQPRVPYIGNAIVALAPIVGGLFVIVATLSFLTPELFEALLATDLAQPLTQIYGAWLGTFIQVFNPLSIESWVMLVVILTVSASLAPSMVDLRSAGIGILIAVIATLTNLWFVVFLFIALVELMKQHENLSYVFVDALLLGGGGYFAAQAIDPSVGREVLLMATLLSLGMIVLSLMVAGALYSGRRFIKKRA
jgi:hypothetical protein